MSPFERRHPVGQKVAQGRSSAGSASTEGPVPSSSRTARLLALAHAIESLCETEGSSGYAEVARRLGISRARVTQVLNLLCLSPAIQEALLVGDAIVSERALRTIVQDVGWERQAEAGVDLGIDPSLGTGMRSLKHP